MYARARPHRRHRLRCRTMNFGVLFHLNTGFLGHLVSWNRLCTAGLTLTAPGTELHQLQQLSASSSLRALVTNVISMPRTFSTLSPDFREDDLFLDSEGVVSDRQRAWGRPRKSRMRRDGHADEPVIELEHARATQGDGTADRLTFAANSRSTSGPAHRRTLPGDGGQLRHRAVDQQRSTASPTPC